MTMAKGSVAPRRGEEEEEKEDKEKGVSEGSVDALLEETEDDDPMMEEAEDDKGWE